MGGSARTGQWHINPAGYRRRWATEGGRRVSILEHREVMERLLERRLRPDEYVHHINGDKTDNRPENLELTTPQEHTRHHSLAMPHPKGVIKMALSDSERARRSDHMRRMRAGAPSWNAGGGLGYRTVVCDACGTSFLRKVSVINRRRKYYAAAACSQSCVGRLTNQKRAMFAEADRLVGEEVRGAE